MTYLRVRTSKVLARWFVCVLVGSTWLASPASAATLTFSNATAITIAGLGRASPYPSIIAVSGITDPIAQVTVTLRGFSHGSPVDIGALLVGPGGQSTFLFDGAGAFDVPADGLTWTFDDNAAMPLPNEGVLSSGTFRPNSYFPTDVFLSPAPAPAPGSQYPQTLSVFKGLTGASANGDWQLYIQDFVGLGEGGLSGGWSVTITTVSVPEPAALALFGLALAGYAARRRRPTTSV